MRLVSLVLLLLSLVACETAKLDTYGMPRVPQSSSPEYSEGWENGCKTGMTAYSSDYMRTVYRVEIDGHRMENPEYSRGWDLAYNYCSYYMSSYLSNKEFAQNDLRSDDTWFNMESDGFLSYKGIDKFDW